ncbi:MAG: SH3 domain-containing protein [Chloroflexia bacterium]|nr:SH3 domain-containing protein [Chloroflexia bacterium]
MGIVLSRRGVLCLAALTAGLLATRASSGMARVRAQDLGTAVDSELLFSAAVEDLPSPPALVRLERTTFESGSELSRRTLEGPVFGLVERGVLSLQAEGDAIVSIAERAGTPAQALVPEAGGSVDLRAGDQVAIPAGVPFALANGGEEEASLLTAAVLPAAAAEAGVVPATGGTPAPSSSGSVAVELLGEAVATGWPAPPYLVQMDRVDVGSGEPVPGFPGPVLLAVEQGAFAFALIDGEIQAAASGPSDTVADAATADTVYRVGEGEAIFFAGGLNALPREAVEPDLVLLRFGVASILQDEASIGPTATGGAEAAPAIPPAETPSSAVSQETDATGTAADGERVRVAADGVRLRSSPSTGGDVVAELAQGVEVIVTGEPVAAEGLQWLPVQAADEPSATGYIAAQFVEPLE